MTAVHNLKVSVSGVRGVVGESLTPSLVAGFAASFGEYVGKGKVVVGRDTRPSGVMFEHAVVAGLISVGCRPVLTGILPTPSIQIAVDELKANGGIAITASHNPADWNALKFIGPSGLFLDHGEAAELLNIYNQPDREYVREADYRLVKRYDNAFQFHRNRIFKHINVDLIRKAAFKVAVDCCNGAGAYYTVQFLEELGCKVVPVFVERDGVFRRKPEPVPENLQVLHEAVKTESCDIGFAQDPDADRLVVMDSRGEPVSEQYTVVLAAEHILSNTPGKVVANIQTTKALELVVKKYSSELFYSRVGEINVSSMMLEKNAIMGGEGSSGGIIWPAVHLCRDSYSGMALMLEMMAARRKSLTEIVASIPEFHSVSAKMNCSAEDALTVLRGLKERYAHLDPCTVDGLRLDWDDAWVLIRPSNTEPVIRVIAEASGQEMAASLVNRFISEIEGLK